LPEGVRQQSNIEAPGSLAGDAGGFSAAVFLTFPVKLHGKRGFDTILP